MSKKTIWVIAIVLIALIMSFAFPKMTHPVSNEPGEITEEVKDTIEYWNEDSAVMASIIDYVNSVTDETSDNFVSEEDRIAVFDFDGTLYGELFPTYFDTWIFVHRALHDETCTPSEEIRKYAEEMEKAFLNHQPEPESDLSTAQCTAELFKNMSYEDYRKYIQDFMKENTVGFDNMTFAEGFYLPMVALVQYLDEKDFTVFISSGSERTMVRELIDGVLDEAIPSHQIIGSTFSFKATNQGSKNPKSYTFTKEDEVLMEGNLVVKNQKTNKVFSIINEIGKTPILVFGNSSGDLAMGEYTVDHGGKGYMLLCDDLERDYGSLETAEKFKKDCDKIGLETVSMKNDFKTIYKEDSSKSE